MFYKQKIKKYFNKILREKESFVNQGHKAITYINV